MKKEEILIILLVSLFLTLSTISAAETSATNVSSPLPSTIPASLISAKTKALSCLDKLVTNCSTLSLEEKIFVTLANGDCKAQLFESSQDKKGECWPAGACSIAQTAQSVIALKQSGKDVSLAKSWLENQTMWVGKIDWYIQIESAGLSECKIEYSGFSYDLKIDEARKLSKNAGLCLFLEEGDPYKLKIKNTQACYSHSYSISCNESFFTTKLYKKLGGETLYVSEKVQSSSPGGVINEKIDSLCFGDSKGCNYLGSLWGALARVTLKQNITSFLPYLITFADEPINQKYLPNAFLYLLTDYPQYRTNLIAQRKTVSSQTYWEVSGSSNKYYDSALALLALKVETSGEKTETINWIIKSQAEDGCWNSGNIRDTAFVAYSVLGVQSTGGDSTGSNQCTNCLSTAVCSGLTGNEIPNKLGCAAGFVCCDKFSQTCEQRQGYLCQEDEECLGDQLTFGDGKTCCNIRCTLKSEEDTPPEETCTLNEGACRADCQTDEEETLDYNCLEGDTCCIKKEADPVEETPKNNSTYFTILLVLIALVVLGIVFKEKIKVFLIKLKSKKLAKDKDKNPKGGLLPRGPLPPGPPRPPFGPSPGTQMPRRVIPSRAPISSGTRPIFPNPSFQRRIIKQTSSPEVDEVLRKLKEMEK